MLVAAFKEPFLHKYMVCIRTLNSHPGPTEAFPWWNSWNGILLSHITDALKPSDVEPPPTCPFIKPTMRKSEPLNRQLSFRSFSGPGGRLPM